MVKTESTYSISTNPSSEDEYPIPSDLFMCVPARASFQGVRADCQSEFLHMQFKLNIFSLKSGSQDKDL